MVSLKRRNPPFTPKTEKGDAEIRRSPYGGPDINGGGDEGRVLPDDHSLVLTYFPAHGTLVLPELCNRRPLLRLPARSGNGKRLACHSPRINR